MGGHLFLRLFAGRVVYRGLTLRPVPVNVVDCPVDNGRHGVGHLTVEGKDAGTKRLIAGGYVMVLVCRGLVLQRLRLTSVSHVVNSLCRRVGLYSYAVGQVVFRLPKVHVNGGAQSTGHLLSLEGVRRACPLRDRTTPQVPREQDVVVEPRQEVVNFILLRGLRRRRERVVRRTVSNVVFPNAVNVNASSGTAVLRVFRSSKGVTVVHGSRAERGLLSARSAWLLPRSACRVCVFVEVARREVVRLPRLVVRGPLEYGRGEVCVLHRTPTLLRREPVVKGAARRRVNFRRVVSEVDRTRDLTVFLALIGNRELRRCLVIRAVVGSTVVPRSLVSGPKYDEATGGRRSIISRKDPSVPRGLRDHSGLEPEHVRPERFISRGGFLLH